MRFPTLTILALISTGASAFGPPIANNGFVVRHMSIRESQSLPLAQRFPTATATSLHMAVSDKTNEPPRKKSRKEELLEEIEESVRRAEARRVSLEAELAVAELERKKLLEEAERAAAIPDLPELGEFNAAAVAVPLAAGGLAAAAVAARSGLEQRSKKVEEERRKKAIAKAAAEQDARNRAAAEARGKAVKSNVSFYFGLQVYWLTCDLMNM